MKHNTLVKLLSVVIQRKVDCCSLQEGNVGLYIHQEDQVDFQST